MELAWPFGLHLACAWFTWSISLALPIRSPVLSCSQALPWSALSTSMTVTFLSWPPFQSQSPGCFTHPPTQSGHLARRHRSYWWSALPRQMFLEWPVLLLQGWTVEAAFITILPGYPDHPWWASGSPTQMLWTRWGSESDWVCQSLSSSMKAQIISPTEKSDAWATAILQGHLDRKIFWQGLHTMIWPSLHFPLVVSSISKKAATGITKKLFKALLPKLGANWFYPVALCFTPPCTLWPWATQSILGARGCSSLSFLRSQ